MVWCVLELLTLVLWVAVGVQVGIQTSENIMQSLINNGFYFPPADTCSPDWVSTRDNLIISSFVFSLLTLLIVVIAGIIFYIAYSQGIY